MVAVLGGGGGAGACALPSEAPVLLLLDLILMS